MHAHADGGLIQAHSFLVGGNTNRNNTARFHKAINTTRLPIFQIWGFLACSLVESPD